MSKKQICEYCGNGEKVILEWSIDDIDNLRDKIQHFCCQEDLHCDYSDVTIKINANGDVFLCGELKTYVQEKI